MKNILIVEDERRLARFMELELTHEGYNVEIVADGQSALMNLMNKEYDVMLLDLMIPIVDGIEVTKRARTFTDIPIIMITARDGLEDKVKGFDIGADEYMTKPFEMEELLARLRALFRKNEPKEKETKILSFRGLTVNRENYEVLRDGERKELTKKEFDLLVLLLSRENVVLSRDQILSDIWDFNYDGDTRIVDVHIFKLRTKIDESNVFIHSERGIGYVAKRK